MVYSIRVFFHSKIYYYVGLDLIHSIFLFDSLTNSLKGACVQHWKGTDLLQEINTIQEQKVSTHA